MHVADRIKCLHIRRNYNGVHEIVDSLKGILVIFPLFNLKLTTDDPKEEIPRLKIEECNIFTSGSKPAKHIPKLKTPSQIAMNTYIKPQKVKKYRGRQFF